MIPIEAVIVLGLLLFAVGFVGVVVRKNLVVMLMSLELLLNGANVILVGLGRRLGSPRGSRSQTTSYSLASRPLTMIRPSPFGWMRTRATAVLRRPVP